MTKINKRSKQNKTVLQERNVTAEIIVQVGGLLLLGLAVFIIPLLFVGMMSSGSYTLVFYGTYMIIFLCNVFKQAWTSLRETNRVDRYIQRALAIYITLLFPIIGYTVLTIFEEYRIAFILGLLVPLLGSIWLWVLLLKKDKFIWVEK